jgi:hypothetical protein
LSRWQYFKHTREFALVAFVIGHGLALGAIAEDRKTLKDAKNNWLTCERDASQVEEDQSKSMHQKPHLNRI